MHSFKTVVVFKQRSISGYINDPQAASLVSPLNVSYTDRNDQMLRHASLVKCIFAGCRSLKSSQKAFRLQSFVARWAAIFAVHACLHVTVPHPNPYAAEF